MKLNKASVLLRLRAMRTSVVRGTQTLQMENHSLGIPVVKKTVWLTLVAVAAAAAAAAAAPPTATATKKAKPWELPVRVLR